jgi:SAM-dependent methyltransferase
MQPEIRRFWDRRASENAFFFVDNRVDYRDPDLRRFWIEGEQDLDRLLGALGVSIVADQRVLEIGCGIGRLTRALAARSGSVQALDVSPAMLEIARRQNPDLKGVEWILGDGATLEPIPSVSVDACVSHVVFQHIPDPAITLGYVREIGRILRPTGWAALQLSNDPSVHRRPPLPARVRASALAAVRRAPRGQHDPRWLGSMVDLDAVRAAAQKGSMLVERVVGEGTQMCCVLTRRIDEASRSNLLSSQ